ncbi:MAG: matrixin family metalloprotease [Planctomycetota bacterium]
MKTLLRGGAVALTLAVLVTLAARQEQAKGFYNLTGWEWQNSTANWRLNNNFPASAGTTANVLTAMQDSANAWHDQACADFTFNYLGSTSSTSVSPNGNNIVFYSSAAGNGTLAVTTSWGTGGPGGVTYFSDFDIRFYGDISWSTSPNGSQYDIQGVATHEFGHALGMDHSTTVSTATMWASTGAGSNSVSRRSLEMDDINGVLALYGMDPTCGGGVLPSPNPPQWSSTPSAIATGILMTAVPGNPSPVEYFFEFLGTGAGGDSSGWLTTPSYFDNGSQPNQAYSYRFKMRSGIDNNLETSWSSIESYTTPAATPGLVSVDAISNRSFQITGIAPNGNPVSTFYAIQVGSMFVNSSGALQATETWLPGITWAGVTVNGLDRVTNYAVQAKARNSALVETGFGPTTNVSTLLMHEPWAAGTVLDGNGDPENVLTINGSAGNPLRQVVTAPGTPFSLDLAKPSQNGGSVAAWILWARFGEPDLGDEYALPTGIGTLTFIPCDILPVPGSITVGSTYGQLACPPQLPAPLAPANVYTHPGFFFPVVNLTFQAVIEASPGVLRTTNAVIFVNQ